MPTLKMASQSRVQNRTQIGLSIRVLSSSLHGRQVQGAKPVQGEPTGSLSRRERPIPTFPQGGKGRTCCLVSRTRCLAAFRDPGALALNQVKCPLAISAPV